MDIIEKRRSIRKYKANKIDDNLINKLIQSAILAPSGGNTQPWRFIIVDDVKIQKEIIKLSHNQKWMETAPVLIVCIADICSRIKDEDDLILDEESNIFELKQIIRDTTISIEHIVLEAVNLGLGTCWVAWFKQNEIKTLLGIPNNKYVVGILTIGYADEEPKQRPRKTMEEIVHKNKW
ncbi:nitroreductase [Spirochaetia bacterium]|nr:nitroreductase [Spirochaetia bacterium]